MDPKLEMTRQWIMRADDDLRLAELIMGDSEPVYWAAAFHAQQCAEKILKGLLTFHDVRAGKTHDIGNLLKISVSVLDGLEQFKDRAGVLTTYAVDSRYPVPHGNVSKEEAAKAMETARSIFEFVIEALPNLEKLP
ncbi:MAG: HEPN domain-containing protein [Planctomycetes bacterium]|nr:HEPN domain-containing protein [Planctomycetota bacterium]MBL7144278.1 HEPN domain-containing protein [Phycisphaerae bacterium]